MKLTKIDIDAWLEYEQRKAERTQRIANVLVAVVLGILGAAGLIHWFACEVC